MARIYGGIEEADLQILIRETMQDLLGQRDDATRVVSERLDNVDERTRQGLGKFDERLETMAQRLQQKVDVPFLEGKFESMEWRCSAADDRITGLVQRAGQLDKEIERKDDETRETNERLDDLSRRFQHKADSAYVDVRIGEIRTQVQRKAEAEDMDQSLLDLRQTLGECRQKLVEKDEQVHMMLQQLSGKVETVSYNAMVEDLQLKADEVRARDANFSQELEKLCRQVQRVEEHISFKIKALGGEQASLDQRFSHVIKSAALGALDETARLDLPGQQPSAIQAIQNLNQAQARSQANAAPAGTTQAQHFEIMSPGKAVRSGSHVAVGRDAQFASSSYAPPPGQAIGNGTVLIQTVVEQGGGSTVLPRAEQAAAQLMHTQRLQQQQQQPQPGAQITRSQSAPGFRPQPGVTVNSTPAQLAMSPASSASPAPLVPGAPPPWSPVALSALPWSPQVAEGKGHGRGSRGGPPFGMSTGPQALSALPFSGFGRR